MTRIPTEEMVLDLLAGDVIRISSEKIKTILSVKRIYNECKVLFVDGTTLWVNIRTAFTVYNR